ncbi:MAG: hypothetical protein KY455_10785 [Euryarchaeota archaeon]|nr:hypothetical protein [Euryarchaeota archaeon]
MNRTIAIAIAAIFVAMALPSGQAGEIITKHYDIPSGANNATCGNPACAVSTSIGSSGWDDEWWCLEDDDVCEEPLDLVIGTTLQTARGALGKGDDGIINMGVFGIVSTCGDCYFDFLVTIADTLPADTMFSFCIITEHQDGRDDPNGDNFCGDVDPRDPNQTPDDIDDPRVEACGSAGLSAPVASGGEENAAVGFVFATHVDSTTGGVCLGSSGDFVVDMS